MEICNKRPPDVLYKYLPPERAVSVDRGFLKCTRPSDFDDLLDSFYVEGDPEYFEGNLIGSPIVFIETGELGVPLPYFGVRKKKLRKFIEISRERYPWYTVNAIIPRPFPASGKNEEAFLRGFYGDHGQQNDDIHVLCLTSDPCSRVMWERYAGNYEGFCIGYSSKSTSISRPKSLSINKISYRDEPITCPKEIAEFWRWYVKHTEYSHEKEWRVVYLGENLDVINTADAELRGIHFPSEDVKKVIFGARATDELKEILLASSLKNAEFFEVEPDFREFKLKPFKN